MKHSFNADLREVLRRLAEKCHPFRPFKMEAEHGAIAQLGERIAGSDEVEGSSPSGSTKSLAE